METPAIGTICWQDLTVQNAEEVRDFYQDVIGWQSQPEDIDFNMLVPATGESVAGICHARGINADLPAQWLIYITVADVEQIAARCRELGGEVGIAPRGLSGRRFCVIRDPAGAVCALFQP